MESASESRLMLLARYTVATLWLAVCMYFALALAFGLGTYYTSDVGLDRLREEAVFLVLSSGVGSYAVGTFLLLTRRTVVSPWLLLGLAPAVIGALNHLGVIR
jgi:hypothetical protein